MQQLTQNYRTGELAISDVPAPAVRPGSVLVAVAASLVSAGTERTMVSLAQASLLGKAQQRPDLVRQVITKAKREGLLTTYQAAMNRLDTLSPLGYSCAGIVIDVGAGVDGVRVGDRVACAGAGYANHAEIVCVPRNLCAPIPEGVAFESAAFATVGAIALQGVRQAAPTMGETIAVIGLGLVGQLTVQLLKANGCRVLGMDLDASRCRLAESLGCQATATGDEAFLGLAQQWTQGHGADSVIITASTKSDRPVTLAAEIARDRGRVVAVGLVGLNIPRKPYYEKELDLRLSRSYGPGRYDPSYEEQGHDYPIGYVRWTEQRNMTAFLELMAQGAINVSPLITHRYPLAEATQAYTLITGEGAQSAIGVVLSYPEGSDRERPARKVVLPSAHAGASKPQGQAIRVGLIGAGLFAQGTLIPALKQVAGAELCAVCSASGLSARHAAQKHGASYCASDAGELLGAPELDAVLIATRHGSHAPLVIQALQAGKPVYVEKPLCVSAKQLADIVAVYDGQLAAGGSPLLMVGFNRRFAPLALELKRFVADSQPLVMSYRVNAGSLPADSWIRDPEQGGGRIIGEVCHSVDFLQFLCGAEPLRVYASCVGGPAGGPMAEDNVIIQIDFADGSVGSISYAANGDKSFTKERVEVFGGGRVAVLDDFRTLEMVSHGASKKRRSLLKQDKGHAGELAAFLGALRAGRPSPIPFDSLVMTTLTTLSARDALRTGLPQAIVWEKEEPPCAF